MVTLNIADLPQTIRAWNADLNKTAITDFSTRDKTLFVWKKVYISIVEGKVSFVELNLFERVARVLFRYHSDTILEISMRNKVMETVRGILNKSVVVDSNNTSNATDSSESPILALPNEMLEAVFEYSALRDKQSIACVCKTWNEVVTKLIQNEQNEFVREHAFGKEMWEKYIGDVGDVPPLPPDIYKILNSPCPFNPGKKVHETHLLTLIPKTVNGKPFTLNNLEELVKAPKEGNATHYRYFWDEIKNEHGDTPVEASYWVLFTKDVIPGSRNKTYDEQKKLVEDLGTKANVPYAVPELLDAATSIFMEFVRSGTRHYSNNPWTYTRIKQRVSKYPNWPLVVGGLAAVAGSSSGGLIVSIYFVDVSEYYGVGGSRKFWP